MSQDAPPPSKSARTNAGRSLTEKQVEALTVAMIVAPGVYARNRMFELFTSSAARRARTRAGVVRGIVPQLARASAITVSIEALGRGKWEEGSNGPESFVLRYVVPAVRMTRVVELSAAELAALRMIAERANVRVLPLSEGDAALVTRTLASLMEDDVSPEVARRASGIPSPLTE